MSCSHLGMCYVFGLIGLWVKTNFSLVRIGMFTGGTIWILTHGPMYAVRPLTVALRLAAAGQDTHCALMGGTCLGHPELRRTFRLSLLPNGLKTNTKTHIHANQAAVARSTWRSSDGVTGRAYRHWAIARFFPESHLETKPRRVVFFSFGPSWWNVLSQFFDINTREIIDSTKTRITLFERHVKPRRDQGKIQLPSGAHFFLFFWGRVPP